MLTQRIIDVEGTVLERPLSVVIVGTPILGPSNCNGSCLADHHGGCNGC